MKKVKILILLLFFLLINYNLYSLYSEEEEILISIKEHKSITFNSRIKKIAIADPSIADVRTLSHYELLINGKKEGSTSLIVWTKSDKISKKIIVSSVDLEKILKEVRKKLKKIQNIKVKVRNGKVMLEGKIISNNDAKVVEGIILKYKNAILNFVTLPVQMVKIEVRVIEIGKRDNLTIGINWKKKFQFIEGKIEGLAQIGEISRTTKVDAVLDFMAQEGKAKIVARPNIIVINGKTASFHSGGTLLLPLISDNQSSVDEKSYGVDLKILPYGDRKSGLVRCHVDIEVSTLDYENAVKTGEGTFPAVKDRRISTEVDVKVGKTIVIGGLLMEEEQIVVNKVPILGSIPLLGYLFSSKDILKIETELLIFLTPSFVNFFGEEIIE